MRLSKPLLVGYLTSPIAKLMHAHDARECWARVMPAVSRLGMQSDRNDMDGPIYAESNDVLS